MRKSPGRLGSEGHSSQHLALALDCESNDANGRIVEIWRGNGWKVAEVIGRVGG